MTSCKSPINNSLQAPITWLTPITSCCFAHDIRKLHGYFTLIFKMALLLTKTIKVCNKFYCETYWASGLKKIELDCASLWWASIQPTWRHCWNWFIPLSSYIHVCCLTLIVRWHREVILDRMEISCLLLVTPGFESGHHRDPLSSHSADSSIKRSGRHTTQTQTSEVRWAARFSGHWVVTSMFA